MKCSKCDKEACFLKYNHKNNGKIDYVEGRCKDHLFMTYNSRYERAERAKLRNKKQPKKEEIKTVEKKQGFWSWLLS